MGLMWNIRATVEKSSTLAQEVRDEILARFGDDQVAGVPATLTVGGQTYELRVKLGQSEKGNLTGMTASRTPLVPLIAVPKVKAKKAENKLSAEAMAEALLGG